MGNESGWCDAVSVGESRTCSSSEQVRVGPSETSFAGTGPRITNPTPPPKHKNNAALKPRETSGFSPLAGEPRRTVAGRAGDETSREIAEAISAIAREMFVLCIDERRSQLGRELHIEAVYRRLACGEPGAVVMDGRCLLTEDAHEEELAIARRGASMRRGGEA